jgi:hypothetical protein
MGFFVKARKKADIFFPAGGVEQMKTQNLPWIQSRHGLLDAGIAQKIMPQECAGLQTGRRQGPQFTNRLDIALVQFDPAHLLEHLIFIHGVSCTWFAFRMVSA